MSEAPQLTELEARLAECQARQRRKAQLAEQVAEKRRQWLAKCREKEEADITFQKETAELITKRGLGVIRFLLWLLAEHDQRLDIHIYRIREAEEISEHAGIEAEKLKGELDELGRQVARLGNAEKDYEAVLKIKTAYLASQNDPSGIRLREVDQLTEELVEKQRELRQAVNAGEAALNSIDAAQNSLSQAMNWGIADFFGGGLIVTANKHHSLDTARYHIRQAHNHLQHFAKEVADANSKLQASLKINGLTSLADFFGDGLIAELLIQSKVRNAQQQCAAIRNQVSTALSTCRRKLQEVTDERMRLEGEKRYIIGDI